MNREMHATIDPQTVKLRVVQPKKRGKWSEAASLLRVLFENVFLFMAFWHWVRLGDQETFQSIMLAIILVTMRYGKDDNR